MPRKKKLNVKVTQSNWNRDKMPRFALAVSTVLVDKGDGGNLHETVLDNLRRQIYYDIEANLHLEVDSINLVLVEENPPTEI